MTPVTRVSTSRRRRPAQSNRAVFYTELFHADQHAFK